MLTREEAMSAIFRLQNNSECRLIRVAYIAQEKKQPNVLRHSLANVS